MPSATRPRNSSGPTSHSPIVQFEQLYNIAVQAFVRRDHSKSLSTLRKLLELLQTHPGPSGVWYDLSLPPLAGEEKEISDWREKVLKLYISSTVSLYYDPKSTAASTIPSATGPPSDPDLAHLLPPSPPDLLLTHLQRTAETHSLPLPLPTPALLSPGLISTLLLASLKLQPVGPALDFAHRLAEEWLGGLPDGLVYAISQPAGAVNGNGQRGQGEGKREGEESESAEQKKRVEGVREGYLKVTELFIGEVLVKEGDWEMARAFLEGEGVMGSKRKENLYRHIRSAESRPRTRSNPSSPSSSMTPPSPSSSGILPKSPSTASSRTGRSRTSSISSSSSEATARPHTSKSHLTVAPRRSARGRDRLLDRKPAQTKRQSDEADDEKEGHDSQSTKSSLPSKLYINHSPASSSRVPFRPRSTSTPPTVGKTSWDSLISLLPKSVQVRVKPTVGNPWLLAAVSLPIPVIVILGVVLGIRRKLIKKRNELLRKAVGKAAEVAVQVGQSTMAVDAMADVRARLRRTRERGVREWVRAWLAWWVRKFLGVWKMGTTITYL